MNANTVRLATRRCAFWLALTPAFAGAVDITPSITLGEIYTSNVELAPDGQEEHEWVTRVVPAVNLAYEGNDLRLDLDYALEALFYARESDRNEVFNQLDGEALFDVIGEDLQLRARGFITQVNVSPEGPISSGNVPVTGNRTDVIRWDIGPEWTRRVLTDAEIAGFVRVGHIDFDDSPRDGGGTVTPIVVETQDVDTLEGAFAFRSADLSTRRLTYELAYEYERVEYDVSGDATQQSTWLRSGYRLRPEWQVFGLVGLDSNFEDPDDTSLDEGRWEAGFAYASTVARLEAAGGHRYFGTTWRLDFQLQDDDVEYRVTYNEAPTTTDLTDVRELPARVPGQALPPGPPDSELDRIGTPARFLYKRADASATRTLFRTLATAGLFWERREDVAEFNPGSTAAQGLDDEESEGVYVDVSWEAGPRSTVGLTGSLIRRTYNETQAVTPTLTEDDLVDLRARLDYELGERTLLGLKTGWNSLDESEGEAGDYDEYWASIEVTRTF